MPRYEYKVVPAPSKGLKAKGVRGAEARFSHAVQELMNGLAGYGWEYQRSETLPSTERTGLTGTTTEWRNVMVFRRLRENDADAFAPELLPAPAAVAPVADTPAKAAPQTKDDPAQDKPAKDDKDADVPPETDIKTAWDNGVEDVDDGSDMGGPVALLAKARKSEKSDD